MPGILEPRFQDDVSVPVVAAPLDTPPVAARLPLRPAGFVSRIKRWQRGVRCFHWREGVSQRFADGSEQPAYRFFCSLRGCSWICCRHPERRDTIYRFSPPKPGYDD